MVLSTQLDQNKKMSETVTEISDPYLESTIRESEPGVDTPIAFDSDDGLIVREAVPRPLEWSEPDGTIIREPEPKAVAAIHFSPGTSQPDTSRRTEILYGAVKSMSEYLDTVESGQIAKPFALRGITNKEMANVAKRFGFRTVRKLPKESWGSYVPKEEDFLLVARYEDVAEAIDKLRDKESLIRKLGERASRIALTEE